MKKNLFRLIPIVCLWLTAVTADGQQIFQNTHYDINGQTLNPAYVGSHEEALTVIALSRWQWTGIEGSPRNYSLAARTPILNETMGVGLSLMQDNIGPLKTTQVYGDFAYKTKIHHTGNLAFGLKVGVDVTNANLTTLTTRQSGDNAFMNNVRGAGKPNFGFGVYYNTRWLFAGISAPRLIETNTDVNSSSDVVLNSERHYFAIAGAVLRFGPDVKFRPSTIIKVAPNAPLEADITANFLLYEKLWLGAMHRTRNSIGLIAGVQITQQLRASYAFDYDVNGLININGGTHELMVAYDFFYGGSGRIKSPRYF